MKSFLILATVVTLTMSSVIQPPKGISPLMRFVASSEGRLFFSDSSELRTWEEAKQFCQDNGMELAKVETREESLALYYAYNRATFDGEFWTAGRDALRATQFVWDDTKVPQSHFDYLLYIRPEFKFQTCIYFKGMISHNILSADLCTETKQTLCIIDSQAY